MDEIIQQLAEQDFSRARSKAFTRHLMSLLLGRPTLLLPFHLVKDKLNITSQTYRGVKPVKIKKIVGSVDRYNEFDDTFLPKEDFTASRWKKINEAWRSDVELPAVRLYKIGDAYFVEDGNHRISVAREMGTEFIDAEITEFSTNVKITEDINPKELIIKSEYSDFLLKTELDKHKIFSDIEFSRPGRYIMLLRHIAVHRYYKGQDEHQEISLPDAAFSWYTNLYNPMIEIFRRHQILEKFPRRTEADLYLWITNHRYFLMQKYGPDVGFENAALDFAEKYHLSRMDSFLEKIGLKTSE